MEFFSQIPEGRGIVHAGRAELSASAKSTGFQALQMGRKYIGIELKPEYASQAAKFLGEAEGGSASMLEVAG